jgi:NAD(P)-dependent dehydrogenase (short-subunit alcohol dehydrogenase family)
MPTASSFQRSTDSRAYVITGPTSGIGLATAFEIARQGTVILVGRDPNKLAALQTQIERKGQKAVSVVCDLSDIASVHRAAAEIVALRLPIVGLVNNAGIMQTKPTKNAAGWDMTYATNHLGPFAFTEALIPHLPDGANVVFVASAVEDVERQPAKRVGFRGSRFISVEASARGEWKPEHSRLPGADAYATSKQGNLATVMVFAKETPRLHFNAVEPGVTMQTNLGHRTGSVMMRVFTKVVVPVLVHLLMPFMKFLSTPKRSARVITQVLLNPEGRTGMYYGEHGQVMQGSEQVRTPGFAEDVVAETRAFLAAVPA